MGCLHPGRAWWAMSGCPQRGLLFKSDIKKKKQKKMVIVDQRRFEASCMTLIEGGAKSEFCF
eukprot:873459-Pelagomonas_calceolata.AAC.1